jgi:hypothetical protein
VTPSASAGETENATAIAGIADSSGPTMGMSSPTPAINART